MHPVPITHHDLARLMQATGLGPEELVDLAGVDDVDLSGEPSSFALLDCGRRVLLLRRRDGACSLLSDERCSVHDARPIACRAYPLHATFGKRGGVRRLRVLRGVDCPFELGETAMLHEVRRDQRRLRAELEQYQQRLATWNRRQRHRQRLGRGLRGARELFAFLTLAQAGVPQTSASSASAAGQASSG